jgi:hypothetical protein
MPESSPTNSQTLVIDSNEFKFETLSDENGYATVIKFKLENPQVSAGDVLLILSGSEVYFHGLIGRVEDGYATASDPRGSQLPARTH